MGELRRRRRTGHLPQRDWQPHDRAIPAATSPARQRRPRFRGWRWRLLFLLVLLLVLFGLIVPYQAGIRVDRVLHDRIDAIPGARITRVEHGLYQRRFAVRLPVPGSRAPLRLHLTVVQLLGWRHGLSWAGLRVSVARTSPVQITDWRDRPLHLGGAIGLLGGLTLRLPRSPHHGEGRLHFDPLNDRLRLHLDLPGLRLVGPRQKWLFGGLHVDADVQLASVRQLVGDCGIDARRLGLVRDRQRWLMDGLHGRLQLKQGRTSAQRDLELGLSLQGLRRLAADGIAHQQLGASHLVWSVTDARPGLVPALLRLLANVPMQAGEAQESFSLDRYWARVRGDALPDLLAALAHAETRVAPLHLRLPAGQFDLDLSLAGPHAAAAPAAGHWHARGRLYLDPAILSPGWRRQLGPLLSALKPQNNGLAGRLSLTAGRWQVNGRTLDYRRLLPRD